MKLTKRFAVLVEDDNGRYFHVEVEAQGSTDARQKVAYILDETGARIIDLKVIQEYGA